MINQIRSLLFALHMEFLNYIEQISSSEFRLLLLFIMCGFTIFIKTTRILLSQVEHARLPYTTRAHGVIRWETDSVYGDRTKMLSD